MELKNPPSALASLSTIKERLEGHAPAFFLDFDGTLAPIVVQPEAAEITEEARQVLDRLAGSHPVCIVSGRSLEFLLSKIALDDVYYAADHGHRIVGPTDSGVDFEVGPDDIQELETAACELEHALREIDGVLIEAKEVSVAVHYRRVAEDERPQVRDAVYQVLESSPGLKLMEGKMVYEVLPDVAWGKGQAVLWMLEHLRPLMSEPYLPICVGDDLTDEDMFVAVKRQGVSVVVGGPERTTSADYRLTDTSEVTDFLRAFAPPPAGARSDVV